MQPLPPMDSTEPLRAGLTLVQRIALLLRHESKTPLGTQFLSPQRCVFSHKKGLGAMDVLVLAAPADLASFELQLRKIMSAPKPNPVEIVVAGGDDAVVDCMKRAKPRLVPKATGLIHIADDLRMWAPSSQLVKKLLDPVASKLKEHDFDEVSWALLKDETREEIAQVHAEGEELQVFIARIRKRRPVATYAIVTLIGLVFAMQMYVSIGSPPTLLRMGALSAQGIARGEWWRLITCTLLHGGVEHVLINAYVLFVLGSFVERILGPARLMVLYFVSALAGSVGSVLFLGDTFSVGASGAIWGLLGAHAVLAFRRQTLLPAAMIPGARKAAVINLGINVAASFLPHVDMWAHFFGGAAGALLLMSGLLTRSLTKEDLVAGHADAPDPGVPSPAWMKSVALLSALSLLVALGIGWHATKPWTLKVAPEFAAWSSNTLGIQLDLPVGLARADARAEEEPEPAVPGEVVFGDVMSDAMTIGVFAAAVDPLDATQQDAELTALASQLERPEHATVDFELRRFTDGRDQGMEVRYSFPSGLIYERAFLMRPGRLIRIEAYRWPNLAAAPEGSAVRIAKTARVP